MRKRLTTLAAQLQAQPHKPLGFAFGALVPLVMWALIWAHTTGGLAGPFNDPRPAAFSIPTD